MPFYEYECANCKFYTEVMQKINDAPLLKCPSCGKNKLKKLISAPVFRLKGGGWYETDFKSDNESKRNLAGGDESDSKSRDTAAPESKSADSKAETKTESKPTESKPAEKASASRGKSASRSVSAKPVKATARPASKAPARKPAPKAKAKAGKRRGR